MGLSWLYLCVLLFVLRNCGLSTSFAITSSVDCRRQPHLRPYKPGETTVDLPIFRSWSHVTHAAVSAVASTTYATAVTPAQAELAPVPGPQSSFRAASETLRSWVRVADSIDRSDTVTLSSEAIAKPSALWEALDAASLRAFATTVPPAPAANPRDPHAETVWFGRVNAYSIGSFVANKLELALMARFRVWAEASGGLQRLLRPSATAGVPTATSAAPPLSPLPGSCGAGLLSKAHLASFWDSLPLTDRWRIVSGDINLPGDVGLQGGIGAVGNYSPTSNRRDLNHVVDARSALRAGRRKLRRNAGSTASVSGGATDSNDVLPDVTPASTSATTSVPAISGVALVAHTGPAGSMSGKQQISAMHVSVVNSTLKQLAATTDTPTASDQSCGFVTPTHTTVPSEHTGPPTAALASPNDVFAATTELSARPQGSSASAVARRHHINRTGRSGIPSDVGGSGVTNVDVDVDDEYDDQYDEDEDEDDEFALGAPSRAMLGVAHGRAGVSVVLPSEPRLGGAAEPHRDIASAARDDAESGGAPLLAGDLGTQDLAALMGFFPYRLLHAEGAAVVEELFLAPLARAVAALTAAAEARDAGMASGSSEDDIARAIGHRLSTRWAESNAMDLIVAEERGGGGMPGDGSGGQGGALSHVRRGSSMVVPRASGGAASVSGGSSAGSFLSARKSLAVVAGVSTPPPSTVLRCASAGEELQKPSVVEVPPVPRNNATASAVDVIVPLSTSVVAHPALVIATPEAGLTAADHSAHDASGGGGEDDDDSVFAWGGGSSTWEEAASRRGRRSQRGDHGVHSSDASVAMTGSGSRGSRGGSAVARGGGGRGGALVGRVGAPVATAPSSAQPASSRSAASTTSSAASPRVARGGHVHSAAATRGGGGGRPIGEEWSAAAFTRQQMPASVAVVAAALPQRQAQLLPLPPTASSAAVSVAPIPNAPAAAAANATSQLGASMPHAPTSPWRTFNVGATAIGDPAPAVWSLAANAGSGAVNALAIGKDAPGAGVPSATGQAASSSGPRPTAWTGASSASHNEPPQEQSRHPHRASSVTDDVAGAASGGRVTAATVAPATSTTTSPANSSAPRLAQPSVPQEYITSGTALSPQDKMPIVGDADVTISTGSKSVGLAAGAPVASPPSAPTPRPTSWANVTRGSSLFIATTVPGIAGSSSTTPLAIPAAPTQPITAISTTDVNVGLGKSTASVGTPSVLSGSASSAAAVMRGGAMVDDTAGAPDVSRPVPAASMHGPATSFAAVADVTASPLAATVSSGVAPPLFEGVVTATKVEVVTSALAPATPTAPSIVGNPVPTLRVSFLQAAAASARASAVAPGSAPNSGHTLASVAPSHGKSQVAPPPMLTTPKDEVSRAATTPPAAVAALITPVAMSSGSSSSSPGIELDIALNSGAHAASMVAVTQSPRSASISGHFPAVGNVDDHDSANGDASNVRSARSAGSSSQAASSLLAAGSTGNHNHAGDRSDHRRSSVASTTTTQSRAPPATARVSASDHPRTLPRANSSGSSASSLGGLGPSTMSPALAAATLLGGAAATAAAAAVLSSMSTSLPAQSAAATAGEAALPVRRVPAPPAPSRNTSIARAVQASDKAGPPASTSPTGWVAFSATLRGQAGGSSVASVSAAAASTNDVTVAALATQRTARTASPTSGLASSPLLTRQAATGILVSADPSPVSPSPVVGVQSPAAAAAVADTGVNTVVPTTNVSEVPIVVPEAVIANDVPTMDATADHVREVETSMQQTVAGVFPPRDAVSLSQQQQHRLRRSFSSEDGSSSRNPILYEGGGSSNAYHPLSAQVPYSRHSNQAGRGRRKGSAASGPAGSSDSNFGTSLSRHQNFTALSGRSATAAIERGETAAGAPRQGGGGARGNAVADRDSLMAAAGAADMSVSAEAQDAGVSPGVSGTEAVWPSVPVASLSFQYLQHSVVPGSTTPSSAATSTWAVADGSLPGASFRPPSLPFNFNMQQHAVAPLLLQQQLQQQHQQFQQQRQQQQIAGVMGGSSAGWSGSRQAGSGSGQNNNMRLQPGFSAYLADAAAAAQQRMGAGPTAHFNPVPMPLQLVQPFAFDPLPQLSPALAALSPSPHASRTVSNAPSSQQQQQRASGDAGESYDLVVPPLSPPRLWAPGNPATGSPAVTPTPPFPQQQRLLPAPLVFPVYHFNYAAPLYRVEIPRGLPALRPGGSSPPSLREFFAYAAASPAPLPPPAVLAAPGDCGVPLWVEYQLHAELLKLQTWCVAHSHFRRAQELRVVWDVARLVTDVMPDTTVRVFGSFQTGLATPSSDVDVLVRGALSPRDFAALADAIRASSWARNVTAVPTAHVPVIKVTAAPPLPESLVSNVSVMPAGGSSSSVSAAVVRQDSDAGGATTTMPQSLPHTPHAMAATSAAGPSAARIARLSSLGWFDAAAPVRLDVTFESPTHRGMAATYYSRLYAAQYAPLGPLVLALKSIFGGHGLNDAFSGGLSSFGVLLMVQAFLQGVAAPALAAGAVPPTVNLGADIEELDRTYVTAPPVQPVSSDVTAGGAPARPFSAVAAAYASLPRDLCGSLADVISAPAPLRMLRMPPVLPPHCRLVPHSGSEAGGVRVEGDSFAGVLPTPTLGRLFLRLLAFIGDEFNPATTCLSAKMGPVPIGSPHTGMPNGAGSGPNGGGLVDPLTIPDPFDPSNNVGRNCFRFAQLQAVLRDARRELAARADEVASEARLECANGAADDDATSKASGLEFPLLSRIMATLRDV